MTRRFRVAAILPALLCLPVAASAQATTSLGFAITTDYVDDGQTQTDGGPAVQGYVEVELESGFYFGAWASNVDFGDDNRVELDLYAGFRNEVGRLSYDLSYYRYYYDATGFDSDELILDLGLAATDTLALALELSSDLDGGSTVTPGLALALPGDLDLSANWDFYDDGGESWDIGVTRSASDTVSVDVRWHDATYVSDGRLSLTLSVDTDINGLFGG